MRGYGTTVSLIQIFRSGPGIYSRCIGNCLDMHWERSLIDYEKGQE